MAETVVMKYIEKYQKKICELCCEHMNPLEIWTLVKQLMDAG